MTEHDTHERLKDTMSFEELPIEKGDVENAIFTPSTIKATLDVVFDTDGKDSEEVEIENAMSHCMDCGRHMTLVELQQDKGQIVTPTSDSLFSEENATSYLCYYWEDEDGVPHIYGLTKNLCGKCYTARGIAE